MSKASKLKAVEGWCHQNVRSQARGQEGGKLRKNEKECQARDVKAERNTNNGEKRQGRGDDVDNVRA